MSDDSACRGRSGETSSRRVLTPRRVSSARPFKTVDVPPSLAELQGMFQRAVTDGDGSVLGVITDSSREARETLLGVYQSAYRARLVEILRNDYAQLARVTGDTVFEVLALGYIAARPSRTSNARWFGAAFPDYLASHPEDGTSPERAELARFGRALNDAFDAADGTRLTLADLAAVPVEAWGDLVFTPHPALRRLDLATNAIELWRWASDGASASSRPEARRLSEPERIAVYRPELTPRYRRLGYEEAMMLDQMTERVSFSGLCEMVGTYGGEDGAALRAASHLKLWIEEGMLSGPET